MEIISNCIVLVRGMHRWVPSIPETRLGPLPPLPKEISILIFHLKALQIGCSREVAVQLQEMSRASLLFCVCFSLFSSRIERGHWGGIRTPQQDSCNSISDKTSRDSRSQLQGAVKGSRPSLLQCSYNLYPLFSFLSISYSLNFSLFQRCDPGGRNGDRVGKWHHLKLKPQSLSVSRMTSAICCRDELK